MIGVIRLDVKLTSQRKIFFTEPSVSFKDGAKAVVTCISRGVDPCCRFKDCPGPWRVGWFKMHLKGSTVMFLQFA